MNFSDALQRLKQGQKVNRAGWNGKGMYLLLVEPYVMLGATDARLEMLGIDGTLRPWIGMRTADNGFVPWLASQTDLLADDWEMT